MEVVVITLELSAGARLAVLELVEEKTKLTPGGPRVKASLQGQTMRQVQ